MNKQKVLALILAGGKGSRLGLLTENKAKPVMPFGGFYRLIDFALSNCLHSQISDVWVIEQYEPHSVNEHLANGRPWDLDRTYGGLQILPPFQSESAEDGFADGNADAIVRHLKFIVDFNPDLLIVLSADHVYKLDFRDVIETHILQKASVTMVTTRLPKHESASRFGVVETGKDGHITNFEYKPDKPKNDLITAEIFVYDAKILIETLKKLKAEKKSVKDYGNELLPELVKNGRAFEHRHNGYWRDVGTLTSFWRAHMELLDEKLKFVFDDEKWQILTLAEQSVPAFIYRSADVKNSLISLGCKIKGSVEHSVMSANVVIETGAFVRDSVILPNAVVKSGVKLEKTIVDSGVKVTKAKVKQIEEFRQIDKNAIIVVGKNKVQSSTEIEE